MPDLDSRVVTSADGTAVEYLSVGYGPDVIVIPGTFAMAAALTDFAMRLAERHTVHIVQRRGRGGSGPQGDRYGIARECEDVEAIRARTGARLIFGHSYGGLVALRAAWVGAEFDAVAVYEPGLSADGSMRVDWTDRARQEVSAGAYFEAFVTYVRESNPDQSRRVPRWLLRTILPYAVPQAKLQQNVALMPEVINEYVAAGRLDGRIADYRDVAAATLLMHGKGSPSRHAVVAARLGATIPCAETVCFPGLDHSAPEDKPGEVADAVLRFFAARNAQGIGRTALIARY